MKKIGSGSILRFKLEHDFGYGYCLVTDFSKEDTFIFVLVQVYNILGKKEYNLDEISKSDFLLNGIRIFEYPNLKGRGAWKVVGNIEQMNIEPPVFKAAPSFDIYQNLDYALCEYWEPRFNLYDSGEPCDFRQVAHLEFNDYMLYKEDVIIRATMEIIKLKIIMILKRNGIMMCTSALLMFHSIKILIKSSEAS